MPGNIEHRTGQLSKRCIWGRLVLVTWLPGERRQPGKLRSSAALMREERAQVIGIWRDAPLATDALDESIFAQSCERLAGCYCESGDAKMLARPISNLAN